MVSCKVVSVVDNYMPAVKTFKEILAWQKGHRLVLSVYDVTKSFPPDERFRLVDQMCRSAVSFPANIAEGFKRKGLKDSLHFYNIAQGSLEELKYYFQLALDLKYIGKVKADELNYLAAECGRLLNGWASVQK